MDSLCRLCMNFGSLGMEPIFRSVMANCIASKIVGVTQLQLFEGDGLPTNVCQQCIFKLNMADTFIQNCVISDKALRAMQAVQNAAARANEKSSSNAPSAASQSMDVASSNDIGDLKCWTSTELQKDINVDLSKTGIDTVTAANFTRNAMSMAEEAEEFAGSEELNQTMGRRFSKDATSSTFEQTDEFMGCCSTTREDDLVNGSPVEEGNEGGTIGQEPNEIYKCGICNGKFSSKYSLARHVKLHSKKTYRKNFKTSKQKQLCKDAPKKGFSANLAALQSKESNEVSDSKENTCGICCKSFVSQLNLARHTCHSIKNRKFPCDFCPKSFSRKDRLNQHLELKHPKKQFECNICYRKFRIKQSLTDHMLVHFGNRSFSCPKCDKCFTKATSLTVHMLVHSDVRPHGCTECSAKFKRREHLKRHMKSHEQRNRLGLNKSLKRKPPKGEVSRQSPGDDHLPSGNLSLCPEDIKDDSIPTCDSMQSSEKSPEIETKTKSENIVCEKLITCTLCGKTFNERAVFDSHVELHKVNNECLFSCEVCGRQFTSKANVEHHMSIHARIARHKCSQCTQCFKTTLGLNEHMKCHENNLQFVCSICSETFTSDEALQFHFIDHVD